MPIITPRATPKIEVIASLFHARRVDLNHYRGHCPGPLHAHNDRCPSLDLREGDDGRVLIHCWVGCSTADLLAAVNLHLRDLFPGKLKRRQALEAARQQRSADAEARARRRECGALADKFRKLNETLQALGSFLARTQDGEEGDRMAAAYHAIIDKLHDVETIYEEQEAQALHERLVRVCARLHVDYRKLLAPYMTHDDGGDRREAAA